ncbi:MAG: DUF6262 family protein [Enterocloster clostridioformis]
MKEVPTKLLEYQDQVRMETEQKVRCAIEELKAEGYTVRIKDLVEYTGLSRSVFAKPHIRKLLENYEIGNPLRITNKKRDRHAWKKWRNELNDWWKRIQS